MFLCLAALGGTSVTLFCATENRREQSSIHWFHNGEEVNAPSDRYSLSSSDSRLTINPVLGTDEGQYICSYEQTSGITTSSSAGCLVVYGECCYEFTSPRTLTLVTLSFGTVCERALKADGETLLHSLYVAHSSKPFIMYIYLTESSKGAG